MTRRYLKIRKLKKPGRAFGTVRLRQERPGREYLVKTGCHLAAKT